MKSIILTGALLLTTMCPAMAKDMPADAAKVRCSLESFRVEVLRGMFKLMKAANELTEEGESFIVKTVPVEDLQEYSSAGSAFLDALDKNITDLGGSPSLTDDQIKEIVNSIE